MSVTFIVPGEPQGKGRARFGRGHTYTPEKTVAYEGLIAWAAKQAMGAREPMTGPVRLSFRAVLSIPVSTTKKRRQAMLDGLILPTKVPDLDNIQKAIGDGMNKIVFADDSQIVRLGHVEKVYGATPGLTVTVERITETGRV